MIFHFFHFPLFLQASSSAKVNFTTLVRHNQQRPHLVHDVPTIREQLTHWPHHQPLVQPRHNLAVGSHIYIYIYLGHLHSSTRTRTDFTEAHTREHTHLTAEPSTCFAHALTKGSHLVSYSSPPISIYLTYPNSCFLITLYQSNTLKERNVNSIVIRKDKFILKSHDRKP